MGRRVVTPLEATIRGVEVHPEEACIATGDPARGDLPAQTRILDAPRTLVSAEAQARFAGYPARTQNNSARVFQRAGDTAPAVRTSSGDSRSRVGTLAPCYLRTLAS